MEKALKEGIVSRGPPSELFMLARGFFAQQCLGLGGALNVGLRLQSLYLSLVASTSQTAGLDIETSLF